MKYGFLLVISAGLFLALSGCQPGAEQSVQPVRKSSLTLRIVHGPDVRSYLSTLKEDFSLNAPTLPDGTKINIEFISEMGVTAARRIARGELKADAWLAPSTSLVNYANSNLTNLGARQVDCQRLFATPIIVATAEKNRLFFNISEQSFSWNEFIEARLQQREKNAQLIEASMSHATPLTSTTGLAALIELSYLAAYNKQTSIDPETLQAEATRKRLRVYQDMVSNYSPSEGFLLSRIASTASNRVLFAITTEQELALYNKHREPSAPKLLALYPREGSYWQDYNFCISKADWVTPAHRAALAIFGEFLTSQQAQLAAGRAGFRPSVHPAGDLPPLTSQYGVDISQPAVSLSPVSGEFVNRLFEMWSSIMRPAVLLVVLDTSGSMDVDLETVKNYLRNWIARSGERDLKGLIVFNSDPKIAAPFTSSTYEVIQALDPVRSLGGSAVYDGIRRAFDLLASSKLSAYRKVVLVLTDGDDKNSSTSLELLMDRVRQEVSNDDIDLTLVGIKREGTDYSDLQRIARSANGTFRLGSDAELASIFEDLFKSGGL